MASRRQTKTRQVTRQRFELLRNLEKALSGPLSVLGLIWLFVVIAQFVWSYQPWLQTATYVIWGIFLIDFAVRLLIAPKRLRFLKNNVILMISLALPALGMLRFLRLFALFPTWQAAILQLMSSVNRSMRVLSKTMQRRGLGYALALTTVVTLAGAAGMYHFEHTAGPAGSGINSYPYAVWWTAMIMTTLGSDYFPHSAPGRILCLMLAIFAFSIFGYITASVSSYFINKDADDHGSSVPSAQQLDEILQEVRALRAEVEASRSHRRPVKPRTPRAATKGTIDRASRAPRES